MSARIIASAVARALGYGGVARTIREQQLTAPAIARLFAMSASPDAGHVAAVVILAAATARFNSCCENFSGDLERDLAIDALGGETGFTAANREAVRLVQIHWHEIRAEPDANFALAASNALTA